MLAKTAALAAAFSLTLATPAPAAARADVALPGTGVTWHEKSTDPVRLSAYGLGAKQTYLRKVKADAFTRQPGHSEVALSRDGTKAAAVPQVYRGGYDSVVLLDRASGAAVRVPTVRKPQTASYASWSRDGKKVALTVERKSAGKWRTTGFTIVDVAARTARTVKVGGASAKASFWWSPDGHLVAEHANGVRFYDTTGKVRRTYPSVGVVTGPEDAFSPSGRQLAMWCPSRHTEDVCLVNPATGSITRRVAARVEAIFGWWDERHLIAVAATNGAYRAVTVDLTGKVTRVLGDISARTWQKGLWLSFTKHL